MGNGLVPTRLTLFGLSPLQQLKASSSVVPSLLSSGSRNVASCLHLLSQMSSSHVTKVSTATLPALCSNIWSKSHHKSESFRLSRTPSKSSRNSSQMLSQSD